MFRACLVVIAAAVIAQGANAGEQREQRTRVLVDEGHHNFHTTTGSYAGYTRLLQLDQFAVSPLRSSITREVLDAADVLVSASALSEPQGVLRRKAKEQGEPFEWSSTSSMPAFTPGEIATLQEWVKQGGGLLLVMDHPPFGAAAASLALAFGVEARHATTRDTVFTAPTKLLDRPAHFLFTRGTGIVGDHPVLMGVDHVVTYTGTSLAGPIGSTMLLHLPQSAVDARGPGVPARPAGGRAQAIALEFSNGRVVVLGEAGMLTTEPGIGLDACGDRAIADPDLGNRRLALNIARWLARREVTATPPTVLPRMLCKPE
jgi:hypothetical protein